MGSPLGAAKYNSLLQGATSLDRLGTTDLDYSTLQVNTDVTGALFYSYARDVKPEGNSVDVVITAFQNFEADWCSFSWFVQTTIWLLSK